MKRILFLWATALLIAIGATQAQNATQSVVHLKDGTKVSGGLIEMRNDTITLKTADGDLLEYPMSAVEQITNASSLGKVQEKADPSEVVRYKIKRVGRDLRIGRGSLDLGQTKILFGNDLYKKYYSAYVLVGTGSAFITAGVLSAGLGAVWHFKGANEIMQRNGRVLLMAAGVSFATGVIMNTVGKVRIGRVVREYNSGRGWHASQSWEIEPGLQCVDGMAWSAPAYTLGASVKITF